MVAIAELVHQTSSSTGSGDLTLAAVNGKQTFNTAFGNGVTTEVFFYFVSNRGAAEYEYGLGHMSDATTLVRDTVLGGTNGTSAVTFSAGTKDVTNSLPVTEIVRLSDIGDMLESADIGVTVQGYDADTAAIAALSPTDNDIIQRKSGAWTNRTMAQLKTDLSLAKGDVGLSNVDNTSDATKNSASATLSNKTLVDPVITGAILEDIYTITDGAAFEIDPGNGTIQQVTLGAARTPAATNFANGESVTLMVDDGTAYTITWTTVDVNWTGGSAPTLATSGWTVIELWKVGGQIFGAHVGDVAA